jgi:O-antigen ligase
LAPFQKKSVTQTRAGYIGTAFPDGNNFWLYVCLCFLSLAFLFGGSPRPEVETLPALRGAAVLFGLLGLCGLTRRALYSAALLACLAVGFLVVLPLIHLIPLPPGWLAAVGGREIIEEIDRTIEASNVWRPLSMSPLGTANALFAGIIPLTTLVLGLNVIRAHQARIAQGLLGLGVISLFIAVGQVIGSDDSALYFYDTTNRGNPVGLFANRNHHALFLACLIVIAPIALPQRYNLSQKVSSKINELMGTTVLFLICLWIAGMALLTGSRSGALATFIALMSVPIITASRARSMKGSEILKRSSSRILRSIQMIIGISIFILFTVWLGRAPAIDRMFGDGWDTDARVTILPKMIELIFLYWPIGSGPGSFEKVFQLHESQFLLGPEYMNHAHNDIIEVLMTSGLVGLVFMLAGLGFWLVLAFRVFVIDRADSLQPLRKVGAIIIFLLFLASITDYPLRSPSLAALFVIAWIWASLPYRPSLSS